MTLTDLVAALLLVNALELVFQVLRWHHGRQPSPPHGPVR